MYLAKYDCEFIFVDTKAKPPELFEFNPVGTVPVLVTDHVIAGSEEILNFLQNTLDNYPLDICEASQALHDYGNQVLGKGTRDWIFTHRDKPKEEWQPSVLLSSQQAWDAALQELEQQCQAAPWFLGANPTIADCALLPRFAIAMHYGLGGLHRFPKLQQWFSTLHASELYQATAPQNFIS